MCLVSCLWVMVEPRRLAKEKEGQWVYISPWETLGASETEDV